MRPTILLIRKALLDTQVHFMKESNILVCNATIKQLKGEISLNINGEYMTESNTLVGNAIDNFPIGVVLENTISLYITDDKH